MTAVMTPTFKSRPGTKMSVGYFLRRQLFHTPSPITVEDVSLAGKTVILTGANGGIGLEATRQFLDLGAKVILAVRSISKGEAAAEDLARGRKLASDAIQVWPLDMSDYASIQAFAERAKSLDRLDIAVLNAAVLKGKEEHHASGYEETLFINYLSTTLLLLLLLPIVKEKRSPDSPGRIVIVSSHLASWTKYELPKTGPILPAFKESIKEARGAWDAFSEYGISKLFNQLFVAELTKHVSSSEVIFTHPDPGMNKSAIGREFTGFDKLMHIILRTLVARDSSVGARVLLHSATKFGEESHGQFIEDEILQPLAPPLYTAEGQRFAKRLYDETLDELSFASVRELIAGKK